MHEKLWDYIHIFEEDEKRVTATRNAIARALPFEKWCYVRTLDAEAGFNYVKEWLMETSMEEFKNMRNIGPNRLKIIKKIKESLSVENNMGAYI